VVPPPKPIPAVIPKPPPVQSKIVVATKPPPRIHYTPVPHPVINHQPPPPTPVPVTPAPQPVAPAPPTSGVPIYGNTIHDIIQADQNVPPALAATGVSGTVVLSITIAPDGHVISDRVVTSSGVPLIDQTALANVLQQSFPPFNNEMPDAPYTFTIPYEISPGDGSGN
jgi:TonB family protein